jgi:deoxyribonuclease-1
MKKLLLITSLLLLSLSVIAAIDISKLHTIIKEKHTNQFEYKVSKRHVFNVDSLKGVVCSAYTPLECKSHNKEKGFNLNIEHTWPQSKGSKYFPAQGDMHHLYVTSKESNSMRANHPFSIVYQSEWSKQGSLFGLDDRMRDSFEPVDGHKGNVARAMFYFSIRYKKSISKSQETLFRSWNKLDPVDEFELLRNNRINSLQGNRNPFIDDELLVNQILEFKFFN